MGEPARQVRAVFWIMMWVMMVGCEVHFGAPPGMTQAAPSPTPGAEGQPAAEGPGGEVWVYTSIYQSVIEELDPIIAAKYPGLKVQWYRAGSEKVATRLDTELRAGGTQADLVLTSDPFWYLKLKQEGHLRPYVTPSVLPIPRQYMDLDGYYATCRVSTMVIVYHPELITDEEAPRSFKALAEPRFEGKVTLGDPLSSGTHFTTTAFLSTAYGWDFYKTLRAQGALASGGNSAVLQRVEGKEYPIGVVLLENVLANRAKGSPVRYLLPEDGVVTIPGNIAIMSSTDNLAGAQALYDLFMSPEGQRAMVAGDMHSANPRVGPPGDTPAFDKLNTGRFEWTEQFTADIQARAPELKSTFDQVMNK